MIKFFVIVGLALCIYKLLNWRALIKNKAAIEELVNETTQINKEYLDEFGDFTMCIIAKYFDTLSTKREQECYYDDYGEIVIDGWVKESETFLERFIFSSTLYEDISHRYSEDVVRLLGKLREIQIRVDKSDAMHEQIMLLKDKISLSLYSFIIQNIKHKKITWNCDPEIQYFFWGERTDSADFGKKLHKAPQIFFKGMIDPILNYFCEHPSDLEEIQKKFGKQKIKMKKIAVSPFDYEKEIGNNLNRLGFNVRVTKASGDQGVDVLADKDGILFAIQCKMYSNPVGNKAVQEVVAGRKHYNCDYGVVVTNTTFTKSARQLANTNNVILLNDNQLENLLEYVE